jgi:Domain of unknown function (DUF5659)
MARDKRFSTLDISTAAYLELNGIQAQLENHDGRIIFVFPISDRLYELAHAYNSNALVPVADFVTALKSLRGRMLTARGQR